MAGFNFFISVLVLALVKEAVSRPWSAKVGGIALPLLPLLDKCMHRIRVPSQFAATLKHV